MLNKLINITSAGNIEKVSLISFLNEEDTLDKIKKIEKAILYFAGYGTQLLKMGFVLNAEDRQAPVDIQTVRQALKIGYLVDPISGEKLSDFKSRIDMVFYTTDKLNNLAKNYVKTQ